ncbi:hypothetical protein ACFL2D_02365 [Patescibacteria group bacterium]
MPDEPQGITIMRVGEDMPKPIPTDGPITVSELLRMAEVTLRRGEICVREGKQLKSASFVNPGDVIVIEENDDNG